MVSNQAARLVPRTDPVVRSTNINQVGTNAEIRTPVACFLILSEKMNEIAARIRAEVRNCEGARRRGIGCKSYRICLATSRILDKLSRPAFRRPILATKVVMWWVL